MTVAAATIVVTSRDAVTVDVSGRRTSVTWPELVAAAKQPDVETAAAYRAMLDRAVSAEVERVLGLPVRLDARVVTVTAGAAYTAEVDIMAGGYSIPSSDPRTDRGASEGGTQPSYRLAEMELADRVSRIGAMQPPLAGRLARQVATAKQIRRGVLVYHRMASHDIHDIGIAA